MSQSESTTKSISNVAELLGKLAGLIVGLSAIAYFIGYRIKSFYLWEAGASWALSLFTPADLIKEAQVVVLVTGVALFLSITLLMDAKITAEKLRRRDVFLTVIAIGFLIGASVTGKYWNNHRLDYTLSVLAGIVFAAAAGFTIGELVGRLNESKHTWSGYHVWLIWFFYVSALAVAPYFLGTNKAKLDLEPKTSSLSVAVIGDSDGEWRVLSVLEGKYFVVRLAEDPSDRQFRLVDMSSDVRILSSRGKPR